MLTTLAYGLTMGNRDFLEGSGQKQGILQAAALAASSTVFLAEDLAAVLFPKSTIGFSDRMMSFCRQYLRQLVSEIETEICMMATEVFDMRNDTISEIGNGDRCYVLGMLDKSGLLGSKIILEHVFVQAQKAELAVRLMQRISRDDLEATLTRYLDHDDANIADAAMGLLVAQGKEGVDTDPGLTRISSLPADIFHALVWPVTAALRKLSGESGRELIAAAERILQEFDEGQSVQNQAQRLAHFIEANEATGSQVPHPLKDGLTLFVARLVHKTNLSSKQIMMFTAEPHMARLITVMKATGFPVQDAISVHAALDGSGQMLSTASYDEIDERSARELLLDWTRNEAFLHAEHRLDAYDMGRS